MVYPVSEWNESWGGETVFVRDGEVTDCVVPKPGRVVVIPG